MAQHLMVFICKLSNNHISQKHSIATQFTIFYILNRVYSMNAYFLHICIGRWVRTTKHQGNRKVLWWRQTVRHLLSLLMLCALHSYVNFRIVYDLSLAVEAATASEFNSSKSNLCIASLCKKNTYMWRGTYTHLCV